MKEYLIGLIDDGIVDADKMATDILNYMSEDEVEEFYNFYFDDDVVVDYDDANGVSQETEDHVPIDQVEKWFKAGYTFAY